MDELVLALAPVQSFRASPTRVYPPLDARLLGGGSMDEPESRVGLSSRSY